MRLSDAIALGRVNIDKFRIADVKGCAIGMAGSAVGFELNEDLYIKIKHKWPWLNNRFECPACVEQGVAGTGGGLHAIYHQFDSMVMVLRTKTLDQLIDWVRDNEPYEADNFDTTSSVVEKKYEQVATS